jgi:SAM-dependent methyltransferase
MAYYYHRDTDIYFNHQYLNSKEHIIPFIEAAYPLTRDMHILEIGCGEGGILKAFLEKGCKVTGVDLNGHKIGIANEYFKEEILQGRAAFISKNIYDPEFSKNFAGQFDLIILKDAIEHIHEQEKIVGYLKNYLKKSGKAFLGFPPWFNPMAGHQQVCHNKLLDKLPYYHLLPKSLYVFILKLGKEPQETIDELLEIKSLGISIERFRRILKRTGYNIVKQAHFFVNPKYKYKFKLKPRLLNKVLDSIPYFREFFITTAYYLIEPKNK